MLRPSIFRDNFFDDFFGDYVRPAVDFAKYSTPNTGLMRTDIKENETGYELSIDLPGYSKEDVEAELKDGYLTITAAKKESKDEKDEKGTYIHRERFYGSCNRSYYVGENMTQDDIKAKFENGILTMTLPKKDAKTAEVRKMISIE